jgi:hypothetical protein
MENNNAPGVFTSASFAAGSVAGAAGAAVGYPLDTLKVRAQTGSKMEVPFRHLFRGCTVKRMTLETLFF